MLKKIVTFLLILNFFIVEVPFVFADDKGLTDTKNFNIKVLIENEKKPKKEKKIDNSLEEDDDIELDEDEEGYSVITIDTDFSNVSEYEQVLDAYKKWNFKILLDSEFKSIKAGEEFPTNIKISTASDNAINLSEYIVDAYILIRDKNGNIIGKQDLWDVSKKIDFLNLLKAGDIDSALALFLKHNFFVSSIPGEYSMELTMLFSAGFLDLDKNITDKYQIEVRSNKLNVVVENNQINCLSNTVESNKYYCMPIQILIFLIMIVFLWIMVIFAKILSYFAKNKF